MSSRVVLTDVLCSFTAAVSVTPRFSEGVLSALNSANRFNGNNISDSPIAPKALDVIARPNGPGGRRGLETER